MVSGLNQENFEQNTKQGRVVIDFYADWCAPCKMMEPIFGKLSNEFKEINFFRMDVDANEQVAANYGVRSIPTILFLKNGKEIGRVIGLIQEDEFKEKLKEVFK